MSTPPRQFQSMNGHHWTADERELVARGIKLADHTIAVVRDSYHKMMDVYGDTSEGAYMAISTTMILQEWDRKLLVDALVRMVMVEGEDLR